MNFKAIAGKIYSTANFIQTQAIIQLPKVLSTRSASKKLFNSFCTQTRNIRIFFQYKQNKFNYSFRNRIRPQTPRNKGKNMYIDTFLQMIKFFQPLIYLGKKKDMETAVRRSERDDMKP